MIIVPAGASKTEPLQASLQSIDAADDGAVFSRVETFVPDDDFDSAAQMRNLGVEHAARTQADWLCFLEPGERLDARAFQMIAPALRRYDGIWGGFGVTNSQGGYDIPKPALYTGGKFLDMFHAALYWWIGCSHFVRTTAARNVMFRLSADASWYADYLIRLWRDYACLKTAQPLTSGAGLPPVLEADKTEFLRYLRKRPQYIEFDSKGQNIRLAYTGRNPVLEREQLRGVFYEAAELAALGKIIAPGATIVDIGANTGNHTVYFARILAARKVFVFEPNPDAVSVLKNVLAANGLDNVDITHLGKGLGRHATKTRLKSSRRGHLGTARLVEALDGNIEIARLDDCITGNVDLIKIDVEDMELDVLEGARKLIAACRPALLVEVIDRNIMPFVRLIEDLDYRIEDIFADQGYANYLLLPNRRERNL